MKMSDRITEAILQLLDESGENKAEIQRNEFAEMMGCVPSQINYVLGSRFTPEHGYQIESHRGGGGYIRITRVHITKSGALMHVVNSIGNSIDSMSARIVLENCVRTGMLSEAAGNMIVAAMSNHVMNTVPPQLRSALRAAILKQTLLTQID